MRTLKVATINILRDSSQWEKRSPWLLKGLAALQADLIALQEVNIQINNALWLAGKLEMAHVYLSPKTGRSGQREGICILSRLPFEEQATLDLKTQNRVAQYVLLRIEDQPLILANGHFYWQPGEAIERERQVQLLLSWLEAIPGNPATIVCGDFNGTPESAAVEMMRHRFISAYADRHGREPEYTAPTPLKRPKIALLRTALAYMRNIRLKEIRPNWRGTLDYIFVNERLRVIDCRVVLDQPAPDNPDIYPSDHFGLVATLELIQ